MLKKMLCYSVCGVLAAMFADSALAQTAAAPSAAPASAPSGESTVGEVIVTASRFAETAQKTPLIITAIDASKLKGVTDVQQLQTLTPGVQLGIAGNVAQTFIRGIGSLNATSTQEGAVAYNADGVFLFTSTMITPLMYDLERIEILKGPQGTLYGRNASGGAVNLLTRGASLGGFNGYVEGEYGNYNEGRVTGAVNVPVNDTLAVRLAGQHVAHDGYLSDGTNDENINSGRLRVLWEPTSTVTLRVGLDGSVADSKGAGASVNPNPTSEKFLGSTDPRAQTGPAFLGGTSLLSTPPNPPTFYKDHQWSAFAQLDVDMGFATLTVLPAYRNQNLDYLDYVPGYVDHEHTYTRQRSLEVRLANRSERATWVVGAYYFKENQAAALNIRNDTIFESVFVNNPTFIESHALFGEATYGIVEGFRLIGGLRYTEDRTGSSGESNALEGPPGLLNPITGALNVQTAAFNPFNPVTNPTGELLDYPISGQSRDHALTWKGGFEADLSPDSMLFATASRGFKGGGTYVDIPQVSSSFKPEYLTAYELGSRNRFFNDTLQVNAELFYWKLRDQQVPYVGFDSVGQVTYLTANAGKAHMDGADVDVVWRATPDDTLHLGVEYLNSRYDSFLETSPSQALIRTTQCRITGDAGPASLAPATVDCSGLAMLRAPKWSGSASYEHRFLLANDSSVVFDADAVLSSPRYLDPTYTKLFRQTGSAIVNTSLTYNAPHNAFAVTAWVRNLGDTRVMTGGGQFVDAYARPTLLPPRTYGVTARYNF